MRAQRQADRELELILNGLKTVTFTPPRVPDFRAQCEVRGVPFKAAISQIGGKLISQEKLSFKWSRCDTGWEVVLDGSLADLCRHNAETRIRSGISF